MTLAIPRNGSASLAIWLLWLTIAWNVIEALIAVSAGLIAGSVALVGFGLDSSIEVIAAGILLWRLGITDEDERVERRERLAHLVVGVTFMVLAAYILGEVGFVLATGKEPESSTAGIILALLSLAVMPALGLLKRWNAKGLGSSALIAESTETLVCSYLSLTLFIGLGANALFGWWWADVAAALAMLPLMVREGLEGIRGEEDDD